MRSKIACWLPVILFVSFIGVPCVLADYTIIVTIGDTTLTQTNNPVNIAGTYSHAATGGQITITDISSSKLAQVLLPNAAQDNVVDSIKLVNAKITANNASVTNFPLSFQAQMTEGPRTPDSMVFYKILVLGLWQTATGSSFLIGDYVKNPLTEDFTFLQAAPYTPGNLLMQIPPSGIAWPPPSHAELTGDRILRVETAIKLANGKWLNFDTGANPSRFIMMYNDSSPDQCPPGGKAGSKNCKRDASLYLPCAMKKSECK
jgi:hypothetical protein